MKKKDNLIDVFNKEQPKVVPLDECKLKFSIHGEKFASYEEYVTAYKKMGRKYMRDKILWEELHITGMDYNKFNDLTKNNIPCPCPPDNTPTE